MRARHSRSERCSRRAFPTAAVRIAAGTLKRESAAIRKSGAEASGSAACRSPARRSRTSGRSYSPAAPLARQAIPAIFRLRPISTVSTFARTSTACSRGRLPASIDVRTSCAIQSASSAVVRNRRNPTGAELPGSASALRSFEIPSRVSKRSGSLNRTRRRAAVRIGVVLR